MIQQKAGGSTAPRTEDLPRPRRARLKHAVVLIGFRSLLVVVSGSIGWGLVEYFLRLGLVDNPLHRQLTPAGERKHPLNKLMILGDSFIYKFGELDSFLLEKLSPYQVEVLNLAVTGAGPLDSLAQAELHARRYSPNIIIFCICSDNDITDTMHRLSQSESSFKIAARSFVRRSYLYHSVRGHLNRPPAVPNTAEIDPTLAEQARKGQVNVYMLTMTPQSKARHVTDNLLLTSSESQRAAAVVEEAIRRVHNICQGLGSKLLLVVFPSSNQVNRAQFEFYRRVGITLDDRTLSTDVPQQRWKAVADSLDVPLVDMLPQFRGLSSYSLYRENDTHFNSVGNALAAEIIMETLARLLLSSARH